MSKEKISLIDMELSREELAVKMTEDVINKNSSVTSEKLYRRPSELAAIFPGATVEPRFNRADLINNAQYYVMKLFLGAVVTDDPNGQSDLVKMTIKDRNYILHKEDYEVIKNLFHDFIRSFVTRKVYDLNDFMNDLDLFTNAIRFIGVRSKKILSIDLNRVRIFWSIPDEWATGWYRSRLPAKYISELMKDRIHIDAFTYLNYSNALFYDVFIYHRIPSQGMLNNLDMLQAEERVLGYDTDDDYFTIPDWSVVSEHLTEDGKDSARKGMKMADFCSTTNEYLSNTLERKSVYECPNLIDLDSFKPVEEDHLRLTIDKKFSGVNVKKQNGSLVFKKDGKRQNYTKDDFETYNPIKIAWFGSNTHDKDLSIVIKPILKLIEKYGIAIRFCFFGYCPPDFVDAYVEKGNSQTTLGIKSHLEPCIDYIEPVPFSKFYDILNTIKPNIGICPLEDNEFNKSKSNIKLLEFSALRVPVIASNVGPYKCIDHFVNGMLCENSEGDWFRSIDNLIRHPYDRHNIGMRARKFAENNSWQTDNDGRRRWIKYFKDICDTAMSRRNIEGVLK